MMRTFLWTIWLCVWTLGTSHVVIGQQKIDWHVLSQVSFSQPDSDHVDPVYGSPTFHAPVKALQGETVILHGYMLPLTVDNKLYILSKYPFTECFFCGGAGKETVVELKLKDELEFDLDEPVTVKGELRLVYDPLQISYQIVDATQVE